MLYSVRLLRFAISLASMLLACKYCNAQEAKGSPMAGFRQGVSFWMTKNGAGAGSLKTPPGQHFTWNKEVFVRADISKKWGGEIGLQHYRLRTEDRVDGAAHYALKMNFIQLNATMQYDVSNPLLGYFVPYLRKVRSFAGVSFSPRLAFVERSPIHAGGRSSSSSRQASVMVGFSYSHQFPITKHWWASSAFTFRTVPMSNFRADEGDFGHPNRALSWQGGLCYELTSKAKKAVLQP